MGTSTRFERAMVRAKCSANDGLMLLPQWWFVDQLHSVLDFFQIGWHEQLTDLTTSRAARTDDPHQWKRDPNVIKRMMSTTEEGVSNRGVAAELVGRKGGRRASGADLVGRKGGRRASGNGTH